MNTKAKGYIYGAVAAATYGMNPLFALPLYENGMNANSVLFFRYLFAIPILAIMIKSRGRSFAIHKADIFPLAVMGLLVAISSLALFLSYNYMDAGVASTILFVYPIMVAVIMALFFKEKISWFTVLCILIALGGIAMLYQGDNGVALDPIGILFVMTSSLSYACYIVGVNQTRLKEMATVQVTFYVLIFGLSVFVAMILAGNQLIVPSKWFLWGNIVALALFPTAISFVSTTKAIHSDSNPRSFGTRYCRHFRGYDFRRSVHPETCHGNRHDHRLGYHDHRQRQHHDTNATIPQALSQTHPQA